MSIPNNILPEDPRQWGRYASKAFTSLSPLYAQLYAGMEHDSEIRSLLALVDSDQPVPVLFFGIVSFLLLHDKEHPFVEFYSTICKTPRPVTEAYPYFRDFCMKHADELRRRLPLQRLQTNEVTRCANLLPAFNVVHRQGGHKPLALIEIGASAGLNLLWDRYGYDYGSVYVGDKSSPIQIHCNVVGEYRPPLPSAMPPVAQRVGIDLAPLHLSSEEDRLLLYAFVWPEEKERFGVLTEAMKLAQQHPPHLLTGDACDHLPTVLAAVPLETTICIYHSYALFQGPASVREHIFQVIAEHSKERELFRISLEIEPSRWDSPRLELYTYQRGEVTQHEWLANCGVHGNEMEWVAHD